MNASAVRAGLFAPALRRRISFATSVVAPTTTPQRLTNEEHHEMRNAKAFTRLHNGYQLPISKLPGSGSMF